MANKGKTRKSIAKRFKITATGKVLRRHSGQDHLNAKQTPKNRREKKKWVELSSSDSRRLRKALAPHL